MKKTFYVLLGLAFLFSANLVKADEPTGFVPSKNYNGNWFGKCLGCPAYKSDSAVLSVWKKDGRETSQSIEAQKKALSKAKAKVSGYAEIAAQAFWTSNVAWAYNNAALALLKEGGSEDKEKAGEAKALLVKAKDLIDNASTLLPFTLDEELKTSISLTKGLGKTWIKAQTPSQKEAFKKENADRKKVLKTIKNNLLFAQRVLGEVPWPKAKKDADSDEVSPAPAESSDSDGN